MPHALKGFGIFLRDWVLYYLLRILAALFFFEFMFWLHLRELGGEDPKTRTGLLAWEGMKEGNFPNTTRVEAMGDLKEAYAILAFLGFLAHLPVAFLLLLAFLNWACWMPT